MALFMWMKVHSQSRTFMSASKTRCWATSARDTRHTWWGCAHMATKPKTLSHSVARLGAIKRKAVSFLGFSVSPQAPAWERAVNWACLMVGILNCQTGRQRSRDPHVAIVSGVSQQCMCQHIMWEDAHRYSYLWGTDCLQLEEKESTR